VLVYFLFKNVRDQADPKILDHTATSQTLFIEIGSRGDARIFFLQEVKDGLRRVPSVVPAVLDLHGVDED